MPLPGGPASARAADGLCSSSSGISSTRQQLFRAPVGRAKDLASVFALQVVMYARQYGADQFSVFCDLGSGRGAPSTIAAYEHDWLACLGERGLLLLQATEG